MAETSWIPVIDLFAGPGGLGEGFSAFSSPDGSRRFRITLSIEMEQWAHRTLALRSFFHHFRRGKAPAEYYAHLRGEITQNELFDSFPEAAEVARLNAWKAELGAIEAAEVDRRIRCALKSADLWVLCGGPPCQAFSVVGRSRNGGIADDDHRVYLYRQYLRILSVHEPPLFIMENVKGLLSSKVKGNEIFEQMLEDLGHPAKVTKTPRRSGARYSLYSLVENGQLHSDPHCSPGDFVLQCENYGIPQSRHRVIIIGVREDLAHGDMPVLKAHGQPIPAKKVLNGLPRLRSGLSRSDDGQVEWRAALAGILDCDFMHSRRNGADAQLRDRMSRTLLNMHDFRADRGAEFIACDTAIDYKPDWFLDPMLGGVCNHVSRPHMTTDLYRYLFAACYARVHRRSPELKDFPSVLHPDHKSLKNALSKGHFDDRFRVQMASRPATTITSHIAKDGHYFIHYDEAQCRSLTVREAARLQTFPDNYYFCGPRTHQYRQVGNAVPPLLARQIAGLVARILKGAEGMLADCRIGDVELRPMARHD
jgi:DNA (cytosine-5)-methyltransferase 1